MLYNILCFAGPPSVCFLFFIILFLIKPLHRCRRVQYWQFHLTWNTDLYCLRLCRYNTGSWSMFFSRTAHESMRTLFSLLVWCPTIADHLPHTHHFRRSRLCISSSQEAVIVILLINFTLSSAHICLRRDICGGHLDSSQASLSERPMTWLPLSA